MKTKRKCRQCNKLLPPSRYFNCIQCVDVLDSDDGDLVYFQIEDSAVDPKDKADEASWAN